MIIVTLTELQSKSINSLIDENMRFTITQDIEDDTREEESTRDVSDKVALLREQYLRRNE